MNAVTRMLPMNTFEVCRDLLGVVVKIIDNVVANPDDPKYRKMKLSNAAIKRKIVETAGGLELMRALGFKRDADDKGYELLVLTWANDEEKERKVAGLLDKREWLQ